MQAEYIVNQWANIILMRNRKRPYKRLCWFKLQNVPVCWSVVHSQGAVRNCMIYNGEQSSFTDVVLSTTYFPSAGENDYRFCLMWTPLFL